jgi:AcrR family transcriptional regulator
MPLIEDSKASDSTLAVGRSSGEMASHIARVAARLFAERGYDATSVREIVEAASVTKPTLYYHFGSKQGLAEALLTRPMNLFIESLSDLVANESNPIALLRRMFEAFISFTAQEPDRSRFLYAICFGPQNSSLQDEMHQFGEAIERVTADCSERLAAAGLIDESRIASCSQVIRGLIMSSTMDHIMVGFPLETGLADRLVVDLLQGFGRQSFRFDQEKGSHS